MDYHPDNATYAVSPGDGEGRCLNDWSPAPSADGAEAMIRKHIFSGWVRQRWNDGRETIYPLGYQADLRPDYFPRPVAVRLDDERQFRGADAGA